MLPGDPIPNTLQGGDVAGGLLHGHLVRDTIAHRVLRHRVLAPGAAWRAHFHLLARGIFRGALVALRAGHLILAVVVPVEIRQGCLPPLIIVLALGHRPRGDAEQEARLSYKVSEQF